MVFDTDNIKKTYEDIKSKGIEIEPPRTAHWGGQELLLADSDGNKIMFL